jgi:hypothetical protein
MGSAGGSISLRPLQFLTIGGFVLAIVALALPWVKLGSKGFNPLSKDIYEGLKLADLAGNLSFPLDALVIAAISLVAVYLILAPMLGKSSPVNIPFIAIAVIFGAALIAIGVLNYLKIHDVASGQLKVGYGVYLVVLGGVLAIVGAVLDMQQQAKL